MAPACKGQPFPPPRISGISAVTHEWMNEGMNEWIGPRRSRNSQKWTGDFILKPSIWLTPILHTQTQESAHLCLPVYLTPHPILLKWGNSFIFKQLIRDLCLDAERPTNHMLPQKKNTLTVNTIRKFTKLYPFLKLNGTFKEDSHLDIFPPNTNICRLSKGRGWPWGRGWRETLAAGLHKPKHWCSECAGGSTFQWSGAWTWSESDLLTWVPKVALPDHLLCDLNKSPKHTKLQLPCFYNEANASFFVKLHESPYMSYTWSTKHSWRGTSRAPSACCFHSLLSTPNTIVKKRIVPFSSFSSELKPACLHVFIQQTFIGSFLFQARARH